MFQHRLYLQSLFLASKGSWIWYGWDDLHYLITYSLNILCMESVFSSMMNRGWIWTWFWSKEKSFIWCLTRCYNTFYIFGMCGSAWLIRFDFERARINCLSCHLYSQTFLCLVCSFSSISWENEFGQLCWKSATVFLRVLLRDRLRHPVWFMEKESISF